MIVSLERLDRLFKGIVPIFKSLPAVLLFPVVLFFAACAPPPPPPPPPAPPAPPPAYQHVVKYSGETLGLIANWYTGKTQNWSLLRDANPNLKPQKMSIGDVVLIPSDLVVRQEPLTKSAVQKFLGGRGEKKKASATSEEGSSVQGSLTTTSEASSGEGMLTKPEEVPVKAETAPLLDPPSSQPSTTELPIPTSVPVVEDKKPEIDELDALEKELESALAERGSAGKATATDPIPAPEKDLPTAAPKAAGEPKATGEEVEREKLLDELLAQ